MTAIPPPPVLLLLPPVMARATSKVAAALRGKRQQKRQRQAKLRTQPKQLLAAVTSTVAADQLSSPQRKVLMRKNCAHDGSASIAQLVNGPTNADIAWSLPIASAHDRNIIPNA